MAISAEDMTLQLHPETPNHDLMALSFAISSSLKPFKRAYAGTGIEIKLKDTSMHFAARAGDLWRIDYYADENPSYVVTPGKFGKTPLHAAAENGHRDAVQRLIARGANVSAPDLCGKTPLYLAAQNGHLSIVKDLVAEGADPSTPSSDYGDTPLYAAAGNGHRLVVAYLFAKGVSVDEPSIDGKTPVSFAALCNQPEIIELLEALGATLETPDDQGQTPAHAAVRTNALEAIRVLVNLRPALLHTPDNPDPDKPWMEKYNHGDTPFQYAVRHDRRKAVEFLASLHPESVHQPYKDGQTPFIKTMLAAGTVEKTPYYKEVLASWMDMLRLLVSLGGADNIPTKTLRAYTKNYKRTPPLPPSLHDFLCELADNRPTPPSLALPAAKLGFLAAPKMIPLAANSAAPVSERRLSN
jgi:ankyrin repeat protein